MVIPITSTFQNDVANMVRANADDPATAARYLNELVEVQVITPEQSVAIWNEATGGAEEQPE